MFLNQIKMSVTREKTNIYYDGRCLISPNIVYDTIIKWYADNDEGVEKFTVLMLDSKNKIIGLQMVSMGHLNATLVHPREVFKGAIISNANSIIIAHNHPSGNVTPSSDDFDITKRLVESGKILGIKVNDHIVIGDNNFYSIREHKAHIFN